MVELGLVVSPWGTDARSWPVTPSGLQSTTLAKNWLRWVLKSRQFPLFSHMVNPSHRLNRGEIIQALTRQKMLPCEEQGHTSLRNQVWLHGRCMFLSRKRTGRRHHVEQAEFKACLIAYTTVLWKLTLVFNSVKAACCINTSWLLVVCLFCICCRVIRWLSCTVCWVAIYFINNQLVFKSYAVTVLLNLNLMCIWETLI